MEFFQQHPYLSIITFVLLAVGSVILASRKQHVAPLGVWVLVGGLLCAVALVSIAVIPWIMTYGAEALAPVHAWASRH